MSTTELQRVKLHASKFQKKEQYIVISAFKTYLPPILGGLSEVKESTIPLTDIRTPEIWNSRDGMRGVHPQGSKSLGGH